MSWRTVVVSSSAKLDLQLGYLVVRKQDVVKIHLSEIYMVIIESTAVSLTAALLCELMKRKIKVIFCDEKRNPCFEMIPYYGSHDSSSKIKKQISWSDEIKQEVWTEIVKEKIFNQEMLLKRLGLKEYNLLKQYRENVISGDATNREGHAAKVYFNALFGKQFTRDAENSINAALNYGYSIILSAFNREIVANGYLTQLALFHDNIFNSFNLASDMMEPFRPLVDDIVYHLNPQKFEHDEKIKLVSLIQDKVSINGRSETVGNAIKIYTKSVFDALNDENPLVIKWFRHEL